MHPTRQSKAERNSPDLSECTSGLAARRTQLCQGETAERPAWGGRGTAPAHPDIPRLAVERGSRTIRAGRRRYREPVTAIALVTVLPVPPRGDRHAARRSSTSAGRP